MKTSRIITTLLMLFLCSSLFGQVYKCRAYESSLRLQDSYGQWGNWGDFSECNILITIDFNKDRIKIFSNEEQIFDIISYEEAVYDKDGDKISSMWAVDHDAVKCRLRLITLYSQNSRLQLYVDYSNINLVYNLNILK